MDEKLAKQVLSAAKRVTKKRGLSGAETASPVKRNKAIPSDEPLSPSMIEDSVILPESQADEQKLRKVTLHTNRAPLVLAFGTVLLKHTMPQQPLSSRLSLAQAVVSVNSKTKAISLGIDKGSTAEDDGWGQGQPTVRIMGRDVRVMKRWGYAWSEKRGEPTVTADDSQDTLRGDTETDREPALWGLDLEALKKSNGPLIDNTVQGAERSGLPIYSAQSARAYLLKSFASPSPPTDQKASKEPSTAATKAEKERNLGFLLQALDLLYSSWAHVLERGELDRRAWAWYVAVRPEVEHGVAGWGGKGEVRLSQILDLRRKG